MQDQHQSQQSQDQPTIMSSPKRKRDARDEPVSQPKRLRLEGYEVIDVENIDDPFLEWQIRCGLQFVTADGQIIPPPDEAQQPEDPKDFGTRLLAATARDEVSDSNESTSQAQQVQLEQPIGKVSPVTEDEPRATNPDPVQTGTSHPIATQRGGSDISSPNDSIADALLDPQIGREFADIVAFFDNERCLQSEAAARDVSTTQHPSTAHLQPYMSDEDEPEQSKYQEQYYLTLDVVFSQSEASPVRLRKQPQGESEKARENRDAFMPTEDSDNVQAESSPTASDHPQQGVQHDSGYRSKHIRHNSDARPRSPNVQNKPPSHEPLQGGATINNGWTEMPRSPYTRSWEDPEHLSQWRA